MRIRTQLFLGTAALVLALVGVQYWLQARQIQILEEELTDVATQVGATLMEATVIERQQPGEVKIIRMPVEGVDLQSMIWCEAEPGESSQPADVDGKRRVVHRRMLIEPDQSEELDVAIQAANQVMAAFPELGLEGEAAEELARAGEALSRVEIRVETLGEDEDRLLVIAGFPGGDRQVPIPVTRAQRAVKADLHRGMAASGILLAVGLAVAGLFSHRVTRPLRELAGGVEALGRGELGTQVTARAGGEVRELQGAFNQMSSRLAELEREREQWQAREHLAELGFLARGLAHTLRNPLNTLGLAVEELAERTPVDSSGLVTTSRSQLRRIDRWLRSFLAVGAGQEAAVEEMDLRQIVRDVALEAVQQGGRVELELPEEPLTARVIPSALGSALGNLVANAVEASEEVVTVSLEAESGNAVIRVLDRGPGLPEEVRRRLFTPHVTTKPSGSGMGLYLARQLVESGHGGSLRLLDGPEGGTVAELRLPLPEVIE